jgi:hypothetical protein
MPEKNASKAASPPAEAPMPTTGQGCAGPGPGRALDFGGAFSFKAIVFIPRHG